MGGGFVGSLGLVGVFFHFNSMLQNFELTLKLRTFWVTPVQLRVIRQSHWKFSCTQSPTYTE